MFQLTFWMSVGILLSVVAGTLIGMAWYGLLAKPWMKSAGLTEADMMRPDGSRGAHPLLYVTATLAQLVMAAMLTGIIHHSGGHSLRVGLISAGLVWLGFVATTTLVNNAFQKKPLSLTLIDAGYWLLVLLAMGAIMGVVGV